MTRLALAAALALVATPALAEYVDVPATGTVEQVSDRLATAIEGAGATLFARVPHSEGAASVDMDLQDAELFVFGNPKLGTPALQDDIRAGLELPLRLLVHDRDGVTFLTYEMVETMFDGLDIPQDAAYRDAMSEALQKLTATAAED